MLLEAVLRRRESLAFKISGIKVSQTPGVLFATPESSAGVRVDEEAALSLSAVFAAANFLSRVTGSLPLQVYRRKSDRNKELAITHPAYRLLHTQPNPEMTAVTFRRVLDFHRLMWGNCYAEIVWDGAGRPAELWPIEPWRIKPQREKDGTLYYLVDQKRRIAPADLIHIPLVSYDGVSGRSFVDYALDSLGLGLGAQEFAARFFGNDTSPGGILEHPGVPQKKARDEVREAWTERHGGPGRKHVLGLLWGGWKFNKDAGATAPEAAQLLETRRFTTEEVARWFNVPPTFIADLSRATFGNIEEQGINLIVYSLGPVLCDYEQEYDRKLLNAPNLYAKHNVAALLKGNKAAQSAWYREMFGIGVYTINDILEFEDRNGIGPDGDRRFVPANMMALDNVPLPDDTPPDDPDPIEQPEDPSEAPPKNVLPPDPNSSMSRVLAAQRRALEAIARNLIEREAKAACRAAERPAKFITWMDGYYPDHSQLSLTLLEPPLLAWYVAGGQQRSASLAAAAWAADWQCASQEGLLAAAECQPAELAGRVAACVAKWPDRLQHLGVYLQ